MGDESADLLLLRQEVEYYRKQADELSGANLKLDYQISGVRHELRQKRKGFQLLSELQSSMGAQHKISSIFEMTAQAVNSTLGMDRTVVFSPTDQAGMFRPVLWLGFSQELGDALGSLTVEFPEAVALGREHLLVNQATPANELITILRAKCGMPGYVCHGVEIDGQSIGIILSGRLVEKKPLYPPLDEGDVDTFKAIAGLIRSIVQNMKVSRLEESDRLKTQFFANISHEFRTPITLTLGPINAILKDRYGDVNERVRAQLEGMLRNQARLLGLVNQILDLAKLESGNMRLQAEKIPDMNEFVFVRANQFRSWTEKRGLELRIELDPAVSKAEVYVDKEKLDRAILNLLSNACKFTKSGYVAVRTSLLNQEILLSVVDSGIGIKTDELPYVFDRFKQADGSASREYAGTGLGLSLVKELVAVHGGQIQVQSEYGKGTTFVVHLPVGKEHLAPDAIIEATDDNASIANVELQARDVREGVATVDEFAEVTDHNRIALENRADGLPIVLYVDDNRDMRHYVRDILAQNYTVLLGVHGKHGIEILETISVDLVLSDLMMPVMTGLEFCRALRANQAHRGLPFVLLTAKADMETKLEGLEEGIDDYLSKPFYERELLARIKNLIKLRQNQQRLAAELRAAREIQQALLPPREQHFERVDLSVVYEPCEELSGDFYDTIQSGDWLYCYLADITSHGTAAAQITYLVKGLFQSALADDAQPSLPDLMTTVGQKYMEYGVDYGVGIQVLRLNAKTRKIEYLISNAPRGIRLSNGEVLALLVDPATSFEDLNRSSGTNFPVLSVDVTSGETIYLFTDGCYEFESGEENKLFGQKRLRKVLSNLSLEKWDEELMRELRAANGSQEFTDDLTVLRLRMS